MAKSSRKSPALKLPALVPPAPEPITITTDTPKVSWVIVTPDLAMNWLDTFNINNRKVREDHVARLAADMAAGRWKGRNGEPIKFDRSGRMFEGQHRCWACVQSGVSFETMLITGCDPDDYSTSGIGRPKNLADFLGPVHGEKSVYLLGATLRLIYAWGHGQLGSKISTATIADLEQVLRDHPNVRESVAAANNMPAAKRLMVPSHVALIHYAGTLENRSTLVNSFLDRIGSGLGLFENDPAYHLRRFLLAQRGPQPGRRRPAPTHVLALIIKAWNATKSGKPVGQLRFIVGEDFPQL